MLLYRKISDGKWIDERQSNDVPINVIVDQFGGAGTDYESFRVPRVEQQACFRADLSNTKYENQKWFFPERPVPKMWMSVSPSGTTSGACPCNSFYHTVLSAGTTYTFDIEKRNSIDDSLIQDSDVICIAPSTLIKSSAPLPAGLSLGHASFNWFVPLDTHGIVVFEILSELAEKLTTKILVHIDDE